MVIVAYEHPLPSDQFVAKAVIFELLCPQALATYRDVTWTIMSHLALPAEEGVEPKCWARVYKQLQNFSNNSSMSCSLASVTKPCKFAVRLHLSPSVSVLQYIH